MQTGLERRLAAAFVGMAAFGATSVAQAADTIVGSTGAKVVRFSSATPGTIEASRTIVGMEGGETLTGIDVRPSTGEVFGLGSTGRLYRVDAYTGAAQRISPDADIVLNGARFGVDFNPSADRLRVMSEQDANYRYNPLNGTLAGTDTSLTPASVVVVAVAYDRNTGGTPATTLFGLDSQNDRLVRIGAVDGGLGEASPNGGVVTDIGPLGVDFSTSSGFDIAGDGTAYASLPVAGTTSLYTINLSTGAATKVGDIGGEPVIGIAVAHPRYTYYTAIGGALMMRMHSDTPTLSSATVVQGLEPGESIVGLDQRPASGELYALTDQYRLFLVDPDAGVATQVGTAALDPAVGSTELGFDFNPVADRIRVVADNETNLRLNPLTGTIASNDQPLNSAGDVTAAAYTNAFPGATTTTLYDVDQGADALLVQNPPNNGTLTQIDPLNVDVVGSNGFDIAPAGGFGFLASALASDPTMHLLRVNLAAGAVTGARVVDAGDSGLGNPVRGLAVMSPGMLSVGATSAAESGGTAKVVVLRTAGRTGPATVEYATVDGSAVAGQDYTATGGVLRFDDGETVKVIDVALLDDTAGEAPETFGIVLAKPGEGALLGTAAATVTLVSEEAVATPPVVTPPVVVPDTTKPLAFITARAGQSVRSVRSRGLRVQVVAGEPATATLTATVDTATRRRLKLSSTRLGRATTRFTTAGVKTVTVRLSSRAKSRFRRARRPVRVKLSATVTDTAKNASTASASVLLPLR